jgi:hypothetical protein
MGEDEETTRETEEGHCAVYSVGRTVRIIKEKRRLAKGFKQNWNLDVFRISKVVRRLLG